MNDDDLKRYLNKTISHNWQDVEDKWGWVWGFWWRNALITLGMYAAMMAFFFAIVYW